MALADYILPDNKDVLECEEIISVLDVRYFVAGKKPGADNAGLIAQRVPNNAVPILTIVAPSAMAAFKSPVMPNEKVSSFGLASFATA
jgi:hypothetical protein